MIPWFCYKIVSKNVSKKLKKNRQKTLKCLFEWRVQRSSLTLQWYHDTVTPKMCQKKVHMYTKCQETLQVSFFEWRVHRSHTAVCYCCCCRLMCEQFNLAMIPWFRYQLSPSCYFKDHSLRTISFQLGAHKVIYVKFSHYFVHTSLILKTLDWFFYLGTKIGDVFK